MRKVGQIFGILDFYCYVCSPVRFSILVMNTDFLLHIDDVRAHIAQYPEPQEVTEMRENILKAFADLEFVEESHQYFLPSPDGSKTELPSVSAFVEQFVPYVNWDEKAVFCARKEGVDVEVIKRRWLENNLIATNNGTSTHLYGENLLYFCLDRLDLLSPVILPQFEKGYLIPYSPKQMAVMAFYKELMSVGNVYPVLAETRVYVNGEKGISISGDGYAGTFDMLFAFQTKGKWKLIIGDFKTNRSLNSEFNRNNGNMMLPPFNDLIDEALSHYVVQLSAYQLALEQLGYEVADRRIIWLKEDGTYDKIRLPYVGDKILDFLSDTGWGLMKTQ